METGSIWTIIITILSTLGVTYFGHWLGMSKDTKLRQDELDRHARYLAIRVVCKLDPFVSGCCEVVNDDGQEDQDGETVPRVEEPTISFPEDVDWRSVPPDLMYRILGFPNELENARQHIAFIVNEIASPPDHSEFFDARVVQYGRLGLTALDLADEIRKTYNIPNADFGSHNPRNTLEMALKKGAQKIETFQESQNELMKDWTV